MKKLLIVLVLSVLLFSCDNKFCYKVTENNENKNFCFENKFNLKKDLLNDVLKESIIKSKLKLKNIETFNLKDLSIRFYEIKDTNILTIDGYKKFDNIQQLLVTTYYSGKNAFNTEFGHSDYFKFFFQNGKLVNLQPIKIELRIDEKINNTPRYSFESKHTVDTTISISWGITDYSNFDENYTHIGNNASIYGENQKRNLAISKNNVTKAIDILNSRNENFSLTRNFSDENSFTLNCGFSDISIRKFYYEDSYFRVTTDNKEKLIKKLNFILNFVFNSKLEYSEWKVTKKNGNLEESYIK